MRDQRFRCRFLSIPNSCAAVAAALVVSVGLAAGRAPAQEAEWIWSPQHTKDQVPLGACYFRKSFTARAPEQGEITIAADDAYELYLNGRRIAHGQSAKKLDRHDITRYLRRGRNLIAVKVTNQHGSTAALMARVQVKERGGGWVNYSTDKTWKTNLRPLPLWNMPLYSDAGWLAAQSFGKLGSTPPWDRTDNVAQQQKEEHNRFKISREFRVQEVLDGDVLGSLIAMTFNEFGQLIVSREGGPLLLLSDTDKDSVPDKVRVLCDKVTSSQGILALNGHVYVTGNGPDGNALYRLSDDDRDGTIETVKTLLPFKGPVGEHGAHGLVLGPDGMIYIIVGNHATPGKPYADSSPHHDWYEGDLFPRYEDPGGHAVGIKAPGGVIIRTDLEGKQVEIVAGGLRNAYDLAFNADGELFAHDSDMESDIGTSWYRPTRLYHILPGGEYGWRSGWAKWPDYFVDALPGILDTGRGSPTGAVVYEHIMFPKRYHGALFLGDWSEGRILAVTLKRSGASYTANSEVFVQGEPLNVTDLDVGPDGALYFITGGRGTRGGLYRITWRGKVPEKVRNLGSGMARVIRQPQPQSAWARQAIAGLKIKLGKLWNQGLVGVATTEANPPHYRTRALEIMQLYGPLPSKQLLINLCKDKNELVRAKAAELLGLADGQQGREALVELLQDSDRLVRRRALEALVRAGHTASLEQLTDSLTSDDRFEAWAARRLLERLPTDQWLPTVLTTDDHRLFIQGSTALLVAHPSKQHALAVLRRMSELIRGFVSDRDFIDMLRVAQLALHRGQIQPDEVPVFRAQMAEEFPSGNSTMNRELARLVAYLQIGSIAERYVEYLNSDDVSDVDKLHLAMHLRFVQSGWTTEQRLALVEFYEKAVQWEGGGSYRHYVMNVARDFAKTLNEEEVQRVLANGAYWPNAAVGVLYKLPEKVDAQLLHTLKELDQQIASREDPSAKRLQVGIVAVLARSGDADSLEYLREIWRRDPHRREIVAMGLAQHPDGENWDYLVRSLPILEDTPAREVLRKLATVNLRPEEPEYYRQVILKGLTLKDDGSELAIALLEHWTGQQLAAGDDQWQSAMAAWQEWFAQTYPNQPPAQLPTTSTESKWDYHELLEYLSSEEAASGSASRGAAVFEKAQCIKCHRFGNRGESMGPDLTGISKRFTRKEILQSILFPSHVISSQYAAKTVITTDGKQYTGIVAPGAAGELVVLDSKGEKRIIPQAKVDEVVPSRISAMPEGLLNELTQQEIADLFAYLGVAPKVEIVQRSITSPD